MDAVLDRAQPRVPNFGGDVGLAQVDEHHDRTVEQPRRVGDALSGDVGGGSVDGLEHGVFGPDVRRAAHADRPGDFGCDVGDDVAIEVERADHVQPLGARGDQRRADVDDLVLVLDVGILLRHLVEDPVEETIGLLHDVVFRHTRHLLATVGTCVLERIPDDALAAWTRDQLERLNDFVRLLVLDSGVQVLFVLAHDHHVEQRIRRLDIRRVCFDRTHVGEHRQALAQRHVEALVAPTAGSRDRSLEEHARLGEALPRAVGDAAFLACEVHLFADFDHVVFEIGACRVEDAEGGVHDFGADAVSFGDCNLGAHSERMGSGKGKCKIAERTSHPREKPLPT